MSLRVDGRESDAILVKISFCCAVAAVFSWGAVHPPLDGLKLRGGGRGGNARADCELRAQVRAVRQHFKQDNWSKFSRRLKRINGVDISAKTCKAWCEAPSVNVRVSRRDGKFSNDYKSSVVRDVVGYARDEHGDRLHRHSLKSVCKELRKRAGVHGVAPDRRTVRRWLVDAGFQYRWRPKGVRLSADNLRGREEFCREAEEKDAAAWEVVCFTDSTYVCKDHVPIPQNDGAWCLSGEQPHPQTAFRHPQTFHVYGGITPFGLIGPWFVERITAVSYLPVLKKICRAAAKIYADNGCEGEFVVQQDNASAHTSDIVQEWIAEKDDVDIWAKGSWPPCSPDLSIIENVWSELQEYVAPYGNEPKTKSAAKQRVRKFFRDYSQERCLKLYGSIPGRITECQANDYYTIKS